MMRTLKLCTVALAMFLGMHPPAGGQIVTDTVRITIEGDLAEVVIQLNDTTIAIGDTIYFSALAFDSEGDPVSAQLTWAAQDTTVLDLDPITGVGVALRKASGGIWVVVRAEKIGEVLIASFRDGDLKWLSETVGDTIFCGQDVIPPDGRCPDNPLPTLQLCAYLVDSKYNLLAEDPGPPICPIVFFEAPGPANSMFAVVPRRRPLFGVRPS
jgi:hypothetical protein